MNNTLKLENYTTNREIEGYFEELFSSSKNVLSGRIEICGREALIKYQLKYTNKKLLLYGAGNFGFMTLFWLKRQEIIPCYVVDKDVNRTGEEFFGIKIINLSDLKMLLSNTEENYLMILAVNLEEAANDVKKDLFQMGVDEIMDINFQNIYDMFWPSIDIYHTKMRFKEVLMKLQDIKSKEVLCELLRTQFYNDYYRLSQEDASQKYWGNGIFSLNSNEYFACLGGGNGDTIFYFLDYFDDTFGKIYCFEPENMNRVKYNLRILPDDIKRHIEYVEYYAGNNTEGNTICLDDYFENKKVTLISMDVEGMEMEVLLGAERLIKEQRPILAISAYHKWDDLINFTQYLSEKANDYQLYLRKYAALHRMSRNETVLYAVPKERAVE